MNLNIADLKQQNLILLETVSGSRAYGLDTPESDTDMRGVLPGHGDAMGVLSNVSEKDE